MPRPPLLCACKKPACARRLYTIAYRRGHYAGTKGAKVKQLERRIVKLQNELTILHLRHASNL